jgi:SAM-dependent methyltransferase
MEGEREYEESFRESMNPVVDGREIALDVPYVPTPQGAAERMVQLAEIKPGELVYDLGCGDGRVLVTAAQRHGVKAIGVDLNPDRVKESIENAKKSGVEDLVTVIEGDIFEQDLKDADVVFLYLFPSVNNKLMPQLEKMKPGSRVISYEFPIAGFQPDHVERVLRLRTQRSSNIYKWVLPFKAAPALSWESNVLDFHLESYRPVFAVKFKGVNNSEEDIHIVQVSSDCESCAYLSFSSDVVKPGESVELLVNVNLSPKTQQQSGNIVVVSEAGVQHSLTYNISYPKQYELSTQSLVWGSDREPKNLQITFNPGSGYKYVSHRFDGEDFQADILKSDSAGVLFQLRPLTKSRSRDHMFIELESQVNMPKFKEEVFITLKIEDNAN